jgi:hypothetical protein
MPALPPQNTSGNRRGVTSCGLHGTLSRLIPRGVLFFLSTSSRSAGHPYRLAYDGPSMNTLVKSILVCTLLGAQFLVTAEGATNRLWDMPRHVVIPSGLYMDTVRQWSGKTHINIDPCIKGAAWCLSLSKHTTPGVDCLCTPVQALEHLLVGTGLTYYIVTSCTPIDASSDASDVTVIVRPKDHDLQEAEVNCIELVIPDPERPDIKVPSADWARSKPGEGK